MDSEALNRKAMKWGTRQAERKNGALSPHFPFLSVLQRNIVASTGVGRSAPNFSWKLDSTHMLPKRVGFYAWLLFFGVCLSIQACGSGRSGQSVSSQDSACTDEEVVSAIQGNGGKFIFSISELKEFLSKYRVCEFRKNVDVPVFTIKNIEYKLRYDVKIKTKSEGGNLYGCVERILDAFPPDNGIVCFGQGHEGWRKVDG
ncbi:MAG: hypothetical protein E5X67_25430 [Mesorhizobium sp.]|uniref:hypothetical protein n=1 Tax=Mesorhizobium sp. TaxID=1871066 RepID=UPI00120E5C04|nr:hypothetical protein [Mesorhizobium sp.]TIP25293.1 MAG: hypothetical protein E5X67_25430 [Mesorhizobium sp.]